MRPLRLLFCIFAVDKSLGRQLHFGYLSGCDLPQSGVGGAAAVASLRISVTIPRMKRRTFLQRTAWLAAAGFFGSPLAQALSTRMKAVGVQLFSLPKVLDEDFAAGMTMLADLGYQEIELFGPFPFSAESAKSNWQQLAPMMGLAGSGYFGLDAATISTIMQERGLRIPSVHTDLDTLEQHMEQLGEAASQLGFSTWHYPPFRIRCAATSTTIDAWRSASTPSARALRPWG